MQTAHTTEVTQSSSVPVNETRQVMSNSGKLPTAAGCCFTFTCSAYTHHAISAIVCRGRRAVLGVGGQ